MDCKRKRNGSGVLAVWASVWTFALPLCADEPPPLPPDQLKQAEEIVEQTKKIGPWENQTLVIEEATDHIFQQQNWNSEPDQFARKVMHDVSQIAPWNPRERQEVFLNAVQQRLKLTHDQRVQLDTGFRQESMMFAMRHFKDVVPIAMEVAKTRAGNQPFTAEQVQDWSNRLRPLMDEGLTMVQRVTQRLEKTMTPEQRELLQADMQALQRRHEDVKKMVEKWRTGNWSPADWGLQNDPIHAAAMAEFRAKEAQKNSLVDAARGPQKPDETTVAVDESAWDKYVKWFCNTYECDERQRGQAETILKNSKKEAITYRSAKLDLLEQYERRIAGEANADKLKAAQAELDRLLSPIGQIFDRMKKKLASLLTAQQRQKFGDSLTPTQTVKRAP